MTNDELLEVKQKMYERQREYFTREGAILAKEEDGTCAYRVNAISANPACAVGCLVSDQFWSDNMRPMNSASVWELTSMDFWGDLEYELFGDNDYTDADLDSLCTYLSETQDKHDSTADNAADFVMLLDTYAKRIGLKVVSC